jgi:hypothetical protein
MWHQEKPNVSLQDYLGLNDEEYQAFAHGETVLKQKFEEKYRDMNAEQAWDHFFSELVKKSHDIEARFNQGEDVSDFFATEVDPVTHQPKREKMNDISFTTDPKN